MSPSKIVILGAGIYGVTAALSLRQRGHAVTLLDPGPLPHPLATSTDLSKAIRMDYGTDEFYMALMELALERWQAWNLHFDETLYHEDGMLFLAGTSMAPGGFEYESYTRLQKRGHPVERLTSDRVRAQFPALAAHRYPDGYLNPRAGWAESSRVVIRLLEEAQRLGVELRAGKTFARLLDSGSRLVGVETTDGVRYPADYVIVAAGAWTPTLFPHLSAWMWAVGQPVFHFQVPDPARFRPPNFCVWGADIANTGWYGFPALPDGTLKIANHGPGRRLHPEEPRTVALDEEEKFRAFLATTFPEIAHAPVLRTRLCLYCDTWDGNFYIDHDPTHEGLIICSGGSGHGFKFAPILGEITADVLERKPNPWAHKFAWRSRAALATEDARFTGE
ncbi:MAG: FAD-dependent oxidoreductase [Anaerolineales bacterium]|nr:FAD-dependent oxidoreductase [Anaerolineales bacterium]